jgi:ubiquinone/menaquinone biosynthesis C-methylase UbiE
MANMSARVLTYAAAQAARVAFYGAHYLAARVMARGTFSNVSSPAHPMPSLNETLSAMRDLFAQDWRNVEAGLYPMPVDVRAELRRARASARFLADVPKVVSRQKRGAHDEVRPHTNALPRYYQQNFHFQTGGYLSEESARLYDFQVEALFAGTADAMRRRAYVPIAEFFNRRKTKRPVLLDIGAGTGGFLSFVKSVQPQVKAIALDLSEPYLARARRKLAYRDVKFLAAPAEAIPLPDASVDAAVSIFVFHELPPKVRAAVAKEIARVLKPGSIFVLADTIQYGDAPAFQGLLDVFPSLLYEPYYTSYAKTNLDKLFAAAGLTHTASDIAYLSKIAVFDKPAGRRRTKIKRGRISPAVTLTKG